MGSRRSYNDEIGLEILRTPEKEEVFATAYAEAKEKGWSDEKAKKHAKATELRWTINKLKGFGERFTKEFDNEIIRLRYGIGYINDEDFFKQKVENIIKYRHINPYKELLQKGKELFLCEDEIITFLKSYKRIRKISGLSDEIKIRLALYERPKEQLYKSSVEDKLSNVESLLSNIESTLYDIKQGTDRITGW